MQKIFTYRDANGFFRTQIERAQLKGRSFVFLGKEGTGKTHLLNRLGSLAKDNSYKVFRTRSFSSNEALMYQVYNELLNQYLGEFKERPLSEIVETFSRMDPETSSKSIFIIDGLENMLQNSRELFIYVARTAARIGFTIIGTITEDYVEDGHSIVRFLNLITNEPDIQLINFERANIEDMKFLLKEAGYNLPVSFIQEVFRLTNGNIRSLTYTLGYYHDQGIINDNMELEEVTYRYFPIPPSSELRFEQIVRDLGVPERIVLEVVSLIQEDLSPGLIADLAQIERQKVIEALEKLKSFGLITENNLNYSILNSRLSDIVMNLVYSSTGYIITDSFVRQPGFENLPFITRLRVYELRKDGSSIEELVNREWREFIDKMSYIGFSQDLFQRLQKIVSSKDAKAHLALLFAQSRQNIGDYDGAMSLYTADDIIEAEPVYAKLSEAKLHQKLNQFQASIGACNSILDMENLSAYDRISTLNVLATNYSFLNMLELGEKHAEEAIEIAEEQEFTDLISDAYGTIGTLRVKRFDLKGALHYYTKAVEICQRLKLFDRELLMLNNIAIIYSYWGDFEQSAKMLTEIIEKSYISGELLSRAYATYNLCEIYYNIGKKDEFRSYFPSAAGLVRMVGETNLSYPFFRFASLVSVDMMSFDSGIKYTEELLKISKSTSNESRETIARGLYLMAQPELSLELQKELGDIFNREVTEVDDFLPTWYLMAGTYFCLKNDLDSAHAAFERQKQVAQTLGDSLGVTVSKLGDVFELLANRKIGDLRELLKDGFVIGTRSVVFPILTRQLMDFCEGREPEKNRVEDSDTIVNLAAMVLMELTPMGIERGELDNFNYFVKCRMMLGKRVIPI